MYCIVAAVLVAVMCAITGCESQEEKLYWKSRNNREEQDFRRHQQQQQQTQNATNKFWQTVETQHVPSFLKLLTGMFYIVVAGAVLAGVGLAAYLYLQQYTAKQKLEHEHEMQQQKLKHEASLRENELRQEAALKEKEMQQQLAIKEQEMRMEAAKFQQQKYNDERKFRLDLGKVYMDACKGAAQNDQLPEMTKSLTQVTQLMVLADQDTSSMANITQMSIMANSSTSSTKRSGVPRRRGRGCTSSHGSFSPPPSIESDIEVVENVQTSQPSSQVPATE
mmetsp:Transcript_142250/g.248047  ORF Transcript_142250/g.248047 Transcript_142250/m.248047 type:complete len:279 (+) Transcript_142250:54-890(+)